ncbi:MAG: FdtA/QdtA family cupin domain-containing protein [Bacteroidaceae bacterium]
MNFKNPIALPEGCQIIKLPTIHENRGNLAFLESEKHLPFCVKRVFWIYGVPIAETRGGHAHWTCAEVVFPINGDFWITVDDGTTQCAIHLNEPNEGLLIPAGVWCSLYDFSNGAVCIAMASEAYNVNGYENNYELYKEKRRKCE